MYIKKNYHPIQTNQSVVYENIKEHKGKRTDTNLLNINFKTIICRTLEPLCLMK